MAYPDDLLTEGERVVLHVHPHPRTVIAPVLAFLVVVGFGAFCAAVVAEQSWARVAWLVLGAAGAVLIGCFTVLPVLRWRTTHLVVTNRRVLVREGVVARAGMDVPMSRIVTVHFRRRFGERMLGCGTLVVESASDVLEFDDVPHVERVYALLYQEVRK